jgi:hypothetical protein
MARWRSHPVLTALGIFVGVVAVLIVAVFAAWDWNWFRPMLERAAAAALGRPVTIANLSANLWRMTLEADGIVVGNPPGFPPGSRFGTIDKLFVTVDPRSVFHDQFHIPALVIDHPQGDLGRNANGTANWTFGSSQPENKNAAEKSKPPPLLGSVIINDGHVRIDDPKTKSNFKVDVHTERPRGGGEPEIVLAADGTYVGEAIQVRFRGGSLLSLRDPKKPYPIDLTADHGETHVAVKGTVQDPSSFGGANVRLHLEGKDLSDLSNLVSVPLPRTPPYRLDGHLDYANRRIRFDDFAGKVGNSDLSGKFAVEPNEKRLFISADMTSENVDLTDLGGLIGTTPGRSNTPDQSAAQKREHQQAAQKSNLFPDTPLNAPALKNNDFDVRYGAKKIQGESIPLDNLQAHLVVKDGVARLDPLDFGVGVGKIISKLTFDAKRNPPHANIDIDFRQLDMRRIMRSTNAFQGAGLIGGRAALDGNGASLADVLGTSNGEVKFFMSGGDISALLVDLAGLDFGNSLLSALGLPQRTTLRCMASDFGVRQGMVDTKVFVIDTTEANIVPSGTINLRDQTIDYTVKTDPKHPSIGAVSAPIRITGPLKRPNIAPDSAALGARAGAAVLGAVLTPLGALIPTIQLGLGKNNNCNELMQSAGEQPTSTQGGNRQGAPAGADESAPKQ